MSANVDIETMINILKDLQQNKKCKFIEIRIEENKDSKESTLFIDPILGEEVVPISKNAFSKSIIIDEKFDPDKDINSLFENFII